MNRKWFREVWQNPSIQNLFARPILETPPTCFPLPSHLLLSRFPLLIHWISSMFPSKRPKSSPSSLSPLITFKMIKSDELESTVRRLVFSGWYVCACIYITSNLFSKSVDWALLCLILIQQHPPSLTQNTSSTTSPTIIFSPPSGRHDDPSNSLASCGLTWDNDYLRRPIIHFLSSRNNFMQDEFEKIEEIIADAVQGFGIQIFFCVLDSCWL